MERVGVPSYEKSRIRSCGVTLLWFVLMYFNWQLCYQISRQHWRNYLPEIKSTSFIWPFCSLPEKFAQELAPMHCGQRCCLIPFIGRNTFFVTLLWMAQCLSIIYQTALLHFVKMLSPVSTCYQSSSDSDSDPSLCFSFRTPLSGYTSQQCMLVPQNFTTSLTKTYIMSMQCVRALFLFFYQCHIL